MLDQELLKRITANLEIFGGKPIVRGMRISVELILSLLAQGETADFILSDYPGLEADDIRAFLAYAHEGGKRGHSEFLKRAGSRGFPNFIHRDRCGIYLDKNELTRL
jgi:uncharacterized protein (DUF433 family)